MERLPSRLLGRAVFIGSWVRPYVNVSSRREVHSILGLTAALGLGLLTLIGAPALSGHLWTQDGTLGSLDDRHAQVLLLVVAPVLWAGYFWQQRAIDRVDSSLRPPRGPLSPRAVGETANRRLPIVAAASGAVAVVFDLSRVLPNTGAWWGSTSDLAVVLRELSLGVSVFVMVSLLVRHVRTILSWWALVQDHHPHNSAKATRAILEYGIGGAALLAVVGIRLVMEAVELPTRESGITPDYYLKGTLYLAAGLTLLVLPWYRILGQIETVGLRRIAIPLALAAIVSLPLAASLALSASSLPAL